MVSSQETLLTQQAKHNLEISGLKEQLDESERRLRASDMDMASLREKLGKARLDSLRESEETMAELKNVYEREKVLLMEENKKLQFELERTVELNSRLQLERRQFEEDYHELRNKKEAVAQWEAQISEIINWVSDEKDARGYLQALASKMTEELEYLKHSGVTAGTSPSEKNWKNRRSQKLEKMELLNLQSNLQSEIHAKQAINEELSKTRSELEASRMEIREYKSRVESYSREMLRKEAQCRDLQQRLENGEGIMGDRPSSQMSFLEQFLKESSVGRSRDPLNSAASGSNSGRPDRVSVDSSTATATRRGMSIESDEGDVEDNRAGSITSSRSNMSEHERVSPAIGGRSTSTTSTIHPPHPTQPPPQPPISHIQQAIQVGPKAKSHQFLIRTFSSPLKCNHCTSLMVGLTRQGVVCEICGFACHLHCRDKVP